MSNAITISDLKCM